MKRVALAVGLVMSRGAAAQPHVDDVDRAKAETADSSARAHYDAHEYEAAIADYRAAYDAMPDPLFLFDIAQAYRQLHDCDQALAFYRDYLQRRPDADNRAKVEEFIESMAACAKPESGPAPPPAAPPQAPAPLSPRTLRLAGITSAALGVALIGTAIYFSEEASDDASQIEMACAHGCAGSAVIGIDRAGQAADRNAIVTYAVGGATLAAGAAMILWTVFHAPGEPPVVTPAPGGATVSAKLRF